MHPIVQKFLDFVETNKSICNKEQLIKSCIESFSLIQDRKVFHCDYFAVRFSYSKNGSFSNTVLSLSALEKYDKIPFFVVLVKGNADNTIYIANSSFLSKISHSSQTLSMTNIKGSFNGSDIMKQIDDKANEPVNFEDLFALHLGIDWQDNLQRLVDASSAIEPVSTKFQPSEKELENINNSVNRAQKFVDSTDYDELLRDLNQRCEEVKESILVASHIENVNIRGRLIEALITADKAERQRLLSDLAHLEQALPTYDTRNGLGDYIRHFEQTDSYTDIKTKVIYLNSNPKMYNIDKFLQCMAEDKSVFMFYFIGIDDKGIQQTALCSVFHTTLLQTMHLQAHWAGRSTRGVAQASGSAINTILNTDTCKQINHDIANKFLTDLLAR